MILEQLLAFFVLFNVSHLYGLAENRLFKEAGELLPGNHFRIYHAMMGGMALTLGWLVWVITHNPFYAAATAVYFALGLDVSWWVRRFVDFTLPYMVLSVARWNWQLTLNLGRERAEKFYNELNAWHLPPDWDNYPVLFWLKQRPIPLFRVGRFRCYWWWVMFGAVTAALLVAGYFY
jgi:hypothetical protein